MQSTLKRESKLLQDLHALKSTSHSRLLALNTHFRKYRMSMRLMPEFFNEKERMKAKIKEMDKLLSQTKVQIKKLYEIKDNHTQEQLDEIESNYNKLKNLYLKIG